jgi:hypothetical protein
MGADEDGGAFLTSRNAKPAADAESFEKKAKAFASIIQAVQ